MTDICSLHLFLHWSRMHAAWSCAAQALLMAEPEDFTVPHCNLLLSHPRHSKLFSCTRHLLSTIGSDAQFWAFCCVFRGPVSGLAYSHSEHVAATVGLDGVLSIWRRAPVGKHSDKSPAAWRCTSTASYKGLLLESLIQQCYFIGKHVHFIPISHECQHVHT